MVISINVDPDTIYPDGLDFYSPHEAYPEYPFNRVSAQKNHVYSQVREIFKQAGLDAENYGTARWNPLKDYISKGDRVFVLCNFVFHKRINESKKDFQAKCTHASVVRAVIDYVLIAAGSHASIRFGNAPLQSCNWEAVLRDTGSHLLIEFYGNQGVDVQARDLRLFTAERNVFGALAEVNEKPTSGCIPVNLADQSYLEGLSAEGDHAGYRISDYPVSRLKSSHAPQKHVYYINKEIMDSDVIFSVPKLKTHEKVGLTVSLKGYVGTIGLKDCLAHHRIGDPEHGGDEYPSASAARRKISSFHDWVYENKGRFYIPALMALDKTIRRVFRVFGLIQAGAWDGNDTAWRMTLDIVKAVHYASRDGLLTPTKTSRRALSLVDAIEAGEGQGPLSPEAVHFGGLVFSDDIVLGDVACATLMGFDINRLKLLHHALGSGLLQSHDLSSRDEMKKNVIFNGKWISLSELSTCVGRKFKPPKGWILR